MRAAKRVALAGVLLLGAVPAPAAGPGAPGGPRQDTVIRLVALPDRMLTRIDEGLMRPGSLEDLHGGGLVLSEQEGYRLLEWVQGDITAWVMTCPHIETWPDEPKEIQVREGPRLRVALRIAAAPVGEGFSRLEVTGQLLEKPLDRVAIDRALEPGQYYALGGWVTGERDDRGDLMRLIVLAQTRPANR